MQFHIDSAFLTDIARSWFWNEKMPYEKSEELLMCCLNTDKLSLEEKKAICKDVIEGRKKFVGIDECQIVDDSKNVRTIDEELKNHTRYNAIAAIKTDIACNPFKYLDPFSVNCSYSELAEKIKSGEIENTISDIEDYDFWKGDDEESVEWAVFEVTTDKPFFLLSYEEYESIELTGFYDSFDEAFEEMKELIAESVNDVFDEDATADDVEDMEDYNVFVHSNKDSKDSGAPLAFASFCDDYPNREWTIFHI